ncbi:MAG: substrate-binding domain-containing protein [Bacteroidaceae bacterium]|nr:substrate-binding domain-containing protein [Bacteroidaceae bacterium]
MNAKKYISALMMTVIALMLLIACGGGQQREVFRTDSKGNTVPVADYVCVAVDETFQPVFEVLFSDFRDRNAKAFVDPLYMPEDSAVSMMLKDSVRAIVITRTLSDQEKGYILDNLRLKVKEATVAYDAITLIANNSNRDTLISKREIQQIMQGKITDWSQLKHANGQAGPIEVVFDNNGSSTVRYMKDSLCSGKQPQGNLRAAKTNEELINYVSRKPNAIGVLGVDWVGNKEDTTRLSFLSTVKIMSVSAENSDDVDDYCQPFQFYIATGSYPLTRGLYIISTDPRVRSMQRNFFFYLTDAPNHNNMGQMMILRFSQLLPYMAVQSHNVVIKRY